MSEDAFFVRRNGKIQGPYDESFLSKVARSGRLLPTDEIALSHDGPWVPARDHAVLASAGQQQARASSASSATPTRSLIYLKDPFTDVCYGPLEASALKSKVTAGEVDEEWGIAKTSSGPWKRLGELPSLFAPKSNQNLPAASAVERESPADKLRNIVAGHIHELKENPSIFCYPDIPLKKQKAISKYGQLLPNETILVFYDSTVLNTGSQGLAFTTAGLRWVDDKKNKVFFPLDDIKSIQFTGHGVLSSILSINGALDYKFNNNVENMVPFLSSYRLTSLASDETAGLSDREKEFYFNIDSQTEDWLEEEKCRMAKSLAVWEDVQEDVPKQLKQDLAQIKAPIIVGAMFPQIEDMLNENLDHDEEVKVMMAGEGVCALCFTNKSIIVVVPSIDHDMSEDGTSGEIKGAVAGHLAGSGLGHLIGSQFGVTGMIVGGLLGSAGGMLAGAEAGKSLTRNVVSNVNPIILPYSSIIRITSGQKSLGNGESSPLFTFISRDYPEPVEFLFERDVQKCAASLLALMKKTVAAAADEPHSTKEAKAEPQASSSGVLERLKILKQTFDAGLISEAEFDEKKKELVALL